MFELGIFCVILLAVGYWATMWTMGRRDDVLHGKFVEADPEPECALMPPPTVPRASAESLQALLAVIQRDLKDAAKI